MHRRTETQSMFVFLNWTARAWLFSFRYDILFCLSVEIRLTLRRAVKTWEEGRAISTHAWPNKSLLRRFLNFLWRSVRLSRLSFAMTDALTLPGREPSPEPKPPSPLDCSDCNITWNLLCIYCLGTAVKVTGYVLISSPPRVMKIA